jgi:hypothetical protein
MKTVIPSPESQILNMLKESQHDKWGFVIYRCTYQNDQDWDRFKRLVHDRANEAIAESDTPEIADSLEWTFVEDRATLGGASRAQLREHFNGWADDAYAIEQPRHHQLDFQNWGLFGFQQYNYFIQVDEEALQSVLSPPEFDWDGQGFVNFVDSRWRSFSHEEYYRGLTGLGDVTVFESIDGCEQENVGWMRITPMLMISTEWYGAVGGFAGGGWYVFYLRPPAVVLWWGFVLFAGEFHSSCSHGEAHDAFSLSLASAWYRVQAWMRPRQRGRTWTRAFCARSLLRVLHIDLLKVELLASIRNDQGRNPGF